MRKSVILLLILLMVVTPVRAVEYTAPEVPENASWLMETPSDSFSEGLYNILKKAIPVLHPVFAEAMRTCLAVICAVLAVSVMDNFSIVDQKAVNMASAVLVGLILLRCTDTMISLGADTVDEISEYGKLFLPVITAATAAQGGGGTSAALYAGTAFFDSLLSSVISKLLIPILYIYLCLCIAAGALGERVLHKLKGLAKQIITWVCKTVLYVFTGYLSITGVVSGTTDAAALKAAKLAISGCIPVVGSILSDASESILVSAGIMKNAAGIYGILAFIAISILPFLKISVYFLLFKITAAICEVFGNKESTGLIKDFSTSFGFLLAMTGTVCLLFLISTVCYMKGVN